MSSAHEEKARNRECAALAREHETDEPEVEESTHSTAPQ